MSICERAMMPLIPHPFETADISRLHTTAEKIHGYGLLFVDLCSQPSGFSWLHNSPPKSSLGLFGCKDTHAKKQSNLYRPLGSVRVINRAWVQHTAATEKMDLVGEAD